MEGSKWSKDGPAYPLDYRRTQQNMDHGPTTGYMDEVQQLDLSPDYMARIVRLIMVNVHKNRSNHSLIYTRFEGQERERGVPFVNSVSNTLMTLSYVEL